LLSGVVEFEVTGPMDLKSAELMQRQGFGPEALSGSVGVKRYGCVHVDCLNAVWVVGDLVVAGTEFGAEWYSGALLINWGHSAYRKKPSIAQK
jgi:hypothetical protein